MFCAGGGDWEDEVVAVVVGVGVELVTLCELGVNVDVVDTCPGYQYPRIFSKLDGKRLTVVDDGGGDDDVVWTEGGVGEDAGVSEGVWEVEAVVVVGEEIGRASCRERV